MSIVQYTVSASAVVLLVEIDARLFGWLAGTVQATDVYDLSVAAGEYVLDSWTLIAAGKSVFRFSIWVLIIAGVSAFRLYTAFFRSA